MSKVKIEFNDPDKLNLIPISIDLLRANCPFDFNIYIKLSDKYVMYIKKGDDIETERVEKFKQIQKLKDKNTERLFVHVAEMSRVDNYIETELEEIVKDDSIDGEEKFDRIQHIAKTAIEVCFADPESKEAYKLTEKAATGLRMVVAKNPKALKKIYHRRGRKTDILQEHCKNVASIALKVAFSLGFREKDLDDLGAAALLHDLGHTQMTQEDIDFLFKKEGHLLTPDDKRIYHDHVVQTIGLLRDKSYVNSRVLRLVGAHEEQLDGKGYPKRFSTMEPLEQILALVNKFDKKVTVTGNDPAAALKEIQKETIGLYDLKYIKKLVEVLKAEEIV